MSAWTFSAFSVLFPAMNDGLSAGSGFSSPLFLAFNRHIFGSKFGQPDKDRAARYAGGQRNF